MTPPGNGIKCGRELWTHLENIVLSERRPPITQLHSRKTPSTGSSDGTGVSVCRLGAGVGDGRCGCLPTGGGPGGECAVTVA